MEEAAVLEAVRSGWISSEGEAVGKFETSWAAVCNRKHGIAVSSGTAALDTAVYALRLPAGSEVIMPTFTIVSCVNAVIKNGLKPVFVDADPVYWGMAVAQIEERITPKTSAIMAVHIYGHPVDMDRVMAIARAHNLRVIEDAAEAHGSHCRSRICGSFGDVSVFSFYANKIITTGEGGMVVCDDDTIAERCRSYRDLGFMKERRFLHQSRGENYRMTNMQAALGLAQIDRLAEFVALKKKMGALYTSLLSDIPDVQLPPSSDWGENIYWVYGIVLGDSYPFNAAQLAERLKEMGIGTRPFFYGMHQQPFLHDMGIGLGEQFPVCERLSSRGLYLPSGLSLSEDHIREVASSLKRALYSLTKSPRQVCVENGCGQAPVISVILPTYNEKGNIVRLIEALSMQIQQAAEFIVVDDNSPDGTAEAVRELARHNSSVKLILRTDERGLTSAIQAGIDQSRGDIVVWMDVDFSHPPEKVPELIARIIPGGVDAAIGSRYVPGGADELQNLANPVVLVQKVCTRALNWFTRIVTGVPFHDWTSGFIAIRGDTIRQIRLYGDYGEYFIFLMARLCARQVRWVEVPFNNIPREVGETKTANGLLGLLSRGIHYVSAVSKAMHLLRRPSRRI
jgi:perosamine synthetase